MSHVFSIISHLHKAYLRTFSRLPIAGLNATKKPVRIDLTGFGYTYIIGSVFARFTA